VQRLDALFDIERAINGRSAEERLTARQERSASLMADLHAWLTTQRARLSRQPRSRKAINYMLRFGPWRSTRGRHVQPHRHRQAQQCRSPGLARRRPRPHCRASRQPSRRPAAVELVKVSDSSCPLNVARRGLRRVLTSNTGLRPKKRSAHAAQKCRPLHDLMVQTRSATIAVLLPAPPLSPSALGGLEN